MARRRNKGEEKRTARNRVRQLLDRARAETLGPDADLASRYAAIARRVGTRYQLTLAADQKMQLCKGCTTYRNSANSRTRVHRGRLVTTCTACGRIQRRPLHAIK